MGRFLLGVVGALALAGGAVRAATGSNDKVAKAAATTVRGARTDADRARKLVEAARSLRDDPDLAVGLLTKAVEYATKSAGLAAAELTGLEALDLLEQRAPKQAETWRDMRLDLLRAAYRHAARDRKLDTAAQLLQRLQEHAWADEQAGHLPDALKHLNEACGVATAIRSPEYKRLAARRDRVAQRQRFVQQVDRLAKSLKRRPNDVNTRMRLIQALVVDLDDPKAATKYLTTTVGEPWKTCVPLAASSDKALTGSAALDLARWYHKSLAPKARGLARAPMLERAAHYYELAISLHEKQDMELLALKKARLEVRREQFRAGPWADALGPDGKIELLKLVELDRLTTDGVWRLSGGVLQTATDRPWCLLMPLAPKPAENYGLTIGFRMPADMTGFGIALPVGGREVAFTLHGSDRDEGGLEQVNGKDYNKNGTKVSPGNTRAGRDHRMDIRVVVKGETARIEVDLNRKALLRWRGEASSLSLPKRPWPDVPDGAIAVRGGRVGTVFTAIRLDPGPSALETVRKPGS